MCGVASLVIGCSYPALPPVGGSTDGGGSLPGGPGATSPVTLDWQIAQPLPAQPTFAPISPAPKVRIAPMFPAGSTGDTSATLAPFVDATYGSDGSIAIPSDYLDQTWRLEYTLADSIPHEVQWRPDVQAGHIAIPIFGRLSRLPVPSGAGYTITPTNSPSSFNNPRVFTTGLWTEGVGPTITGSTLDFNLTRSISLSGNIGLPDPAFGDQAFVVDYSTQAGCRVATGDAAFNPTLQAGAHTAVHPAWEINPISPISGADINQSFGARLNSQLDGLATYVQNATTLLFGISPSTAMPGLTNVSSPALQLYNAQLPVPVMLTLLECPISGNPEGTSPSTISELAAYPTILHAQIVGVRTALGMSLISGMETVLVGTSSAFSLSFPTPLTEQFTLSTSTARILLDGASEQIDIGPLHGTFILDFTPESGADLHADYYEVVVHQIANDSISTERIYTVTSPSVMLDSALFTPNADYVFEVRAITGHPQATHGDFSTVTYPYGTTIVYPRTIKTGPLQ